jgi:hypothetical protein
MWMEVKRRKAGPRWSYLLNCKSSLTVSQPSPQIDARISGILAFIPPGGRKIATSKVIWF